VQADRSLGVAGSVKHLRGKALETHNQTVCRPSSGCAVSGVATAQPRGLLLHHLQQRQVVLVEEDRRAGEAFELERAADVVDVRVRQQDLLELETQLGQALVNAANLVSGIDDDGFMGVFIAQNRAIAGNGPTGKDSRIMGRL
jgi:hypothetical protein